MTVVLGETVLLNGGPFHGRRTDVRRPMPERIQITDLRLPTTAEGYMAVLAGTTVPMRAREHYKRAPITYGTSKGQVVVWVYDWEPDR